MFAARCVGGGCAVCLCTLSVMGSGVSPAFEDRTAACGINFQQVPAPAIVLSVLPVHRMMGAGAAGDFNNDGWQDLFILSGGSEPDRLYMNTGNGTFINRASEWAVAQQHMGIGLCVGDVDRDGRLDVFVVSWGASTGFQMPVNNAHRLYRNQGSTFTNIAASAGVNQIGTGLPAGWGPAFGDYDQDGDLDLAVPSWTNGGLFLFRNEFAQTGQILFTHVTAEAGVQTTGVQGFSAMFSDMDGDRRPELLLAADFGTSRYFVNNGDGTFTDATAASGTGLDGNGMGHAVGDTDGDGKLDWFVTSIWSQNSGAANIPGTGNMLYQNQGNHTYTIQPEGSILYDGAWGWGTEIVDLNNDGFNDIVETNGWPFLNGNGETEWDNRPSYLYRNLANGDFEEMGVDCGFIHYGEGRGLVRLDIDNDGDQDIVIFGHEEFVTVLENRLEHGPETNWTRLFFNTLENPKLAPNGFGTQVLVTSAGRTQRGVLHGGSTFNGTSELSIHMGLGSATIIDELRIDWPDFTTTVMYDVPVNQTLTIDAGLRADLTGSGTVNFRDMLRLLQSFGSDDAVADLNADGIVDLEDLLILIYNWS